MMGFVSNGLISFINDFIVKLVLIQRFFYKLNCKTKREERFFKKNSDNSHTEIETMEKTFARLEQKKIMNT